jgi:hypothetical protein
MCLEYEIFSRVSLLPKTFLSKLRGASTINHVETKAMPREISSNEHLKIERHFLFQSLLQLIRHFETSPEISILSNSKKKISLTYS